MPSNRGFFGIGIYNIKKEHNIGTLWRSAHILGADFMFLIGRRYNRQSSDTMKSYKHIPLYEYQSFDDFYQNGIPKCCPLVGIEIDDRAQMIKNFVHPERCIYLLGAEDHGLSPNIMKKCHYIVQLPGDNCLNVSVAGSIILYDRINKK